MSNETFNFILELLEPKLGKKRIQIQLMVKENDDIPLIQENNFSLQSGLFQHPILIGKNM